MTTFEVTFESAEGRALKLLVAADNWVEAWQDGLFALGIDAVPEDATCEVTDDGVRGELPSQGRRFRVRVVRDPVSRPARGLPRLLAAAPNPSAEPPEPPTQRKTTRGYEPPEPPTRREATRTFEAAEPPTPRKTTRGYEPPEPATQREATRTFEAAEPATQREATQTFEPPEPPTARKTTRGHEPPEPATQREATQTFELPEPPTAPSKASRTLTPPRSKRAATEPAEVKAAPRPGSRPSPRPVRSDATSPAALVPPARRPETPDPIARVLSDLERQRLLARPMRISPQTGLPTPVPAGRGTRRTPTPQNVPRPGAADERQRPRRATTAFSVDGDASLPQEFRPVLSAQAPADLPAALQWAADTAWEHVPCGLALLVGVDVGLVATLDDREPLDDVVVHGEILAARGELARELKGCLVPVSSGPATLTARRPSRIRFSEGARLAVESLDERTWHIPITSVLRVPLDRMDAERLGFGILGLVLVNATRGSGFTDGEASATAYLVHTLANLATS